MADPGLVKYFPLGKGNKSLEKSSRLIGDQGSWNKSRIVYVLPAGNSIPPEVFVSHLSLLWPLNNPKITLLLKGYEVGTAYDLAVDHILQDPVERTFDFMLTAEHDIIVQPDTVIRLVKAMHKHPELDAISALYFTRGGYIEDPNDPDEVNGIGYAQIWGDKTDPEPNSRPLPPDPREGLMECWAIGQGFALWRIEMFREMEALGIPRPWFRTLQGDEPGQYCNNELWTQDHYFWMRPARHPKVLEQRPQGYRCAVDCSIKAGHLDIATGVVW